MVALRQALPPAGPMEIVDAGVDCVLYMPRACEIDDVCWLLASGVDIVTTRGEFHHPASLDSDIRARAEAACAIGDASSTAPGAVPDS